MKIFEKGGRESQKYPWKLSKSIFFTGGENFHEKKKTLILRPFLCEQLKICEQLWLFKKRGKDTSVQKNHRKRHFCFYVWKKSHFCTSKDTTVYQKSLLSIKSHFCLYRIIFHPKTKAAFEKDTSVLPKVTSVLKKWSFAKFPSKTMKRVKLFFSYRRRIYLALLN